MITLKRSLLLLLIFTFILSSCSLQKRHYMQGYHITWKNAKHKNRSTELVPVNPFLAEDKIIETKIATASLANQNTEAASALNDNTVFLLSSKKIELNTNYNGASTKRSNEVDLKTHYKSNTEKNNEVKKPIGGGGGGKAIGVIFIIVGLLLMIMGYVFYTNLGAFVGSVFLMLFGIGGAIFFIIGIIALLVK